MTVELDMTNFLTFFWSFLKMIRVDILDHFQIPILNITYWDFTISVAVVAVVMTVLISGVRIGALFGSAPSKKGNVQKQYTDEGSRASLLRHNLQHGHTSNYSASNGKPPSKW